MSGERRARVVLVEVRRQGDCESDLVVLPNREVGKRACGGIFVAPSPLRFGFVCTILHPSFTSSALSTRGVV